MKLSKEIVEYLSERIVSHLTQEKMIEYDCDAKAVAEIIGGAIIKDLMVEDALNEEVKEILKEQEEMIDENNINYRKMFQMIKGKLARERGLIL